MKAKKLELADFKLKSVSVEFRYDTAYLLWDKAGALWSNLKPYFPDLKNIETNPNLTSFRAGDNYQLHVELDKSHITAFHTKLNDVIEPFENFLTTVRKTLEIKSYNRLGFRAIYEKTSNSREESFNIFDSVHSLPYPQGKFFNIDGKIYNPELSYRWEDDKFGLRVLINTPEKSVRFDAPIDIDELKSIDVKKYFVTVDLDYYTKAPTTPGQIKLSEWVKQIIHFINRDSNDLIGI